MKKLENLKWKPMWTTHISCLIGCKNYLEVPVSDAAIFGGTGHTFILNMHEECCPSGPTAWMTGMIFQLGQNLGLNSEVVFSEKNHPDFAEKQKEAFEFAKSSIDRGIPCYGWELDMAEYFIIHGYDENGYYVSGPNADGWKRPNRLEHPRDKRDRPSGSVQCAKRNREIS